MILAKVIGNVISTVKNKNLVGYKLLLVKEIDEGPTVAESAIIFDMKVEKP